MKYMLEEAKKPLFILDEFYFNENAHEAKDSVKEKKWQ